MPRLVVHAVSGTFQDEHQLGTCAGASVFRCSPVRSRIRQELLSASCVHFEYIRTRQVHSFAHCVLHDCLHLSKWGITFATQLLNDRPLMHTTECRPCCMELEFDVDSKECVRSPTVTFREVTPTEYFRCRSLKREARVNGDRTACVCSIGERLTPDGECVRCPRGLTNLDSRTCICAFDVQPQPDKPSCLGETVVPSGTFVPSVSKWENLDWAEYHAGQEQC